MLELGEDAPARAESTCDHQDFAPKKLSGIPAGAAIQILLLRSSPALRVKPEPPTSTLRPKLDCKTKPGPR
jgi:hypothetical protein